MNAMKVRLSFSYRVAMRQNCLSLLKDRAPPSRPEAAAEPCVMRSVRVHRYPDGRMAVFHGPRRLAEYESDGALVADDVRTAPACAAVAR